MMDIKKSKEVFKIFFETDGESVCKMHQQLNNLSDDEIGNVVNGYIEYMLLKTLASDTGAEDFGEMRLSASPEIDSFWHSHILCTENYAKFMLKVREMNPLVETLHHSLRGSCDPPGVKFGRRDATRAAYLKVFGRECSWLQKKEPEDSVVTCSEALDGDRDLKRRQASPLPMSRTSASKRKTFQIYIMNDCSGTRRGYIVCSDFTVKDVKVLVEQTEGCHYYQKRLIFEGKELEDTKRLDDYNIRPESNLYKIFS